MAGFRYIGAAKLASKVGVVAQTIHSWVKVGMPKHDRDEFDEKPCLLWIARRYYGIYRDGQTGDANLTAIKRRKLTAEADTAEEKLAILRGEHVPIDDVIDALSELSGVIKQQIRNLPTLAPRLHVCTVNEIAQILGEKGREILDAVANMRVSGVTDAEPGADADPETINEA